MSTPSIVFGIPTPSTKVDPVSISVPVTATDDVGILTTGITLITSTLGEVINLVQSTPTEVTFNVNVSATGTIIVEAVDTLSNSVSASDLNYIIRNDTRPPQITFSEHNPSNKHIFEDTGSVHIKVVDFRGSLAEPISACAFAATSGSCNLTDILDNISLTSASVGDIDESSIVLTSFPTTVEFDVINISATGSVEVSAKDDFGNGNLGYDNSWIYACEDNDRLINLTNFLPTHLQNSEVFDFVEFFENFLNSLYTQTRENTVEDCNISILKKIENLATLHDPDTMDLDYIQFFANYLGYNVDVTRGTLGVFVTSEVTSGGIVTSGDDYDTILENAAAGDEEAQADLVDINKYLRFVIRNLPNWYRIKTTRNAVKVMLFSFGIIGDILFKYTERYDDNDVSDWYINRPDGVNVRSNVPLTSYPTPHFTLAVDLFQTPPTWINTINEVLEAIKSIKPINTVLDEISGFYRFSVEENTGNVPIPILINNSKIQLTQHIPWVGQPASPSNGNSISVSNPGGRSMSP